MEKLTTKRQISALAFLFCLTYTVSYITRINYGAIISAMESATGLAKELLSLSLTGSFITYGVGQILSGVLGDRFSPKKLIAMGFVLTSLMNFTIPFCKSPYLMLAVWCINGFAQSLMWPPMVRLMTVMLDDESYKSTSSKISWGSSFGTITVYLVAPLLLTVFDYRSVFFFSAALGVIMLVIWLIFAKDVEVQPRQKISLQSRESLSEEPKNTGFGALLCPMMVFAMIGIALQGMLRDGITTWMPSYISETYNLDNVVSILSGVIMPIFSIVCIQVSTILYKKMFKNPLILAALFFGVGGVSSLILFLLTGASAIGSILFSALITASMHGTNLMLTAMLPPFFKKYGKVSTVSGILNSCTYIGSAISTYGIAFLSARIGWRYTVLIWAGVAALGVLACVLGGRSFQKTEFSSTMENDSADGYTESEDANSKQILT